MKKFKISDQEAQKCVRKVLISYFEQKGVDFSKVDPNLITEEFVLEFLKEQNIPPGFF